MVGGGPMAKRAAGQGHLLALAHAVVAIMPHFTRTFVLPYDATSTFEQLLYNCVMVLINTIRFPKVDCFALHRRKHRHL